MALPSTTHFWLLPRNLRAVGPCRWTPSPSLWAPAWATRCWRPRGFLRRSATRCGHGSVCGCGCGAGPPVVCGYGACCGWGAAGVGLSAGLKAHSVQHAWRIPVGGNTAPNHGRLASMGTQPRTHCLHGLLHPRLSITLCRLAMQLLVEDLNFSVPPGSCVGIIGGNGAGGRAACACVSVHVPVHAGEVPPTIATLAPALSRLLTACNNKNGMWDS